MKAYHLYLIRHGMTQGNDEGRYIGSTDQPLSPHGEQALQKMAQSFQYPDADMFFTSPLQRCVRTLEILYPHAQPQVIPDLRECDFGAFENKTMEELKNDATYQEWVAAKGSVTPPDGEPTEQFQQRCCNAFVGIVGQLLRTGTTRAVICAHGGTIMFILSAFGYPNRPFYRWMTGNGQGYEIVITPQLWMSAQAFDIAAPIPEDAPGTGLAGLQGVLDAFEENPEP